MTTEPQYHDGSGLPSVKFLQAPDPPPVKVYCEDGQPVVFPTHLTVDIHDHPTTAIVWRANDSVFAITKIEFQDPSEFTPPTRITDKLWLCVDLGLHEGQFKYDIWVKCNETDPPVLIDPYINNEDGGG